MGRAARIPLRALAVLPARIGSTRLARKVLLAETGAPLFVHTQRAVTRCPAIEAVVVATDSEEVRAAAAAAGIEALLTSPEHRSGTDRVHEAAARLGAGFDVIVNVQADEPEIAAEDLTRLVQAFADPSVEAATLCAPLADPAELASPTVVKVVRDARGDALYFSRAPVPCRAHARVPAPPDEPLAWRHVGVYAYRPAALALFCSLPHGRLEVAESLEQLRWLESGRRMRVIEAARAPRGIDTAEDYRAFVQRQALARDPGDAQPSESVRPLRGARPR